MLEAEAVPTAPYWSWEWPGNEADDTLEAEAVPTTQYWSWEWPGNKADDTLEAEAVRQPRNCAETRKTFYPSHGNIVLCSGTAAVLMTKISAGTLADQIYNFHLSAYS